MRNILSFLFSRRRKCFPGFHDWSAGIGEVYFAGKVSYFKMCLKEGCWKEKKVCPPNQPPN